MSIMKMGRSALRLLSDVLRLAERARRSEDGIAFEDAVRPEDRLEWEGVEREMRELFRKGEPS